MRSLLHGAAAHPALGQAAAARHGPLAQRKLGRLFRVGSRDAQQSVQLLAVALWAMRYVIAADQGLEPAVAVATGILIEGHRETHLDKQDLVRFHYSYGRGTSREPVDAHPRAQPPTGPRYRPTSHARIRHVGARADGKRRAR